MKVQGKVKKIVERTKGYGILIDNDWYGLFEKPCFEVGQEIKAEYYKKGDFNNIDPKKIEILDVSMNLEEDRTESIMKQSCLKASSHYSKTAEENIQNAKILIDSIKQKW